MGLVVYCLAEAIIIGHFLLFPWTTMAESEMESAFDSIAQEIFGDDLYGTNEQFHIICGPFGGALRQ